jgi:myo-inositol-1(or 4)-monophosphatase
VRVRWRHTALRLLSLGVGKHKTLSLSYEHEHEVACAIASAAAREIAARFKSDMEVRYKTPIEPVTEADEVADRVLRRGIMDAFPNDSWLSEESADNLSRLQNARVWIVDPLDGTREFIAGRPEFMVSVGLVVQGRPTVGVCINPITSEVYSAVAGRGAWLDGSAMQVNKSTELSETPTVVSRSEMRRGLLEPFADILLLEAMGGMANKLMAVASGRACATFTTRRRCEWDLAAGTLILQEAGGALTSLNGGSHVFNQAAPYITGVLGSNGRIHQAMRQALAERVSESEAD